MKKGPKRVFKGPTYQSTELSFWAISSEIQNTLRDTDMTKFPWRFANWICFWCGNWSWKLVENWFSTWTKKSKLLSKVFQIVWQLGVANVQVPERFQKALKGFKRLRKVSKGSERFQKAPKGSERFRKIQKGSERFQILLKNFHMVLINS